MSVDQAVGTAPVLACVLERWSVDRYGTWALVVTLDPANGAAGVHANAPVGTVFGVLPAIGSTTDLTAAVLQPGRHQLAAGVIVYGPCTTLALTLGDGTDIYVLDPRSREFRLVRRRTRIQCIDQHATAHGRPVSRVPLVHGANPIAMLCGTSRAACPTIRPGGRRFALVPLTGSRRRCRAPHAGTDPRSSSPLSSAPLT
jgi:hypothetical protein